MEDTLTVEETPTIEKKHSILGIISFSISILSGLTMFALIGYATFCEITTEGGINEESTIAIVLGLGMFVIGGILLVAIGLGIAGLFQKNSKKIFSILGLVLSSATVLATLALILVGSYAE